MADSLTGPGELADGLRDALAVAAAGLARDEEAASAIVGNSYPPLVIGCLCALLADALSEHGTSPAGWIAARQARMRGEAAG